MVSTKETYVTCKMEEPAKTPKPTAVRTNGRIWVTKLMSIQMYVYYRQFKQITLI